MDDCKNGEAIHSDKVETWKSGLYAHCTSVQYCSRLLLSAFWQLSKLNFHLEKLENDTTEWITNWGSELAEWEVEEFESCKLLCTLCNLPIHYLGLSGDLTHTFLKKQSWNFFKTSSIFRSKLFFRFEMPNFELIVHCEILLTRCWWHYYPTLLCHLVSILVEQSSEVTQYLFWRISNFRTFSAAEKVFNTIFDVKIMDDIKYLLNDTPYHCLLLKYLFFLVAKVRDLC